MLRTGSGRGDIFSNNIPVTRTLNIEDFKEKLSDRKLDWVGPVDNRPSPG